MVGLVLCKKESIHLFFFIQMLLWRKTNKGHNKEPIRKLTIYTPCNRRQSLAVVFSLRVNQLEMIWNVMVFTGHLSD